jgi:hypothetical protein
MRLGRLLALLLTLAALVGGTLAISPRARLVASATWGRLRATPVREACAADDEAHVYVAGTVEERLSTPFSARSLFTLRDDTGKVVVVTRTGAPAKGTNVLVEGRVERDLGPFRGLTEEGCIIEAHRVMVTRR